MTARDRPAPVSPSIQQPLAGAPEVSLYSYMSHVHAVIDARVQPSRSRRHFLTARDHSGTIVTSCPTVIVRFNAHSGGPRPPHTPAASFKRLYRD